MHFLKQHAINIYISTIPIITNSTNKLRHIDVHPATVWAPGQDLGPARHQPAGIRSEPVNKEDCTNLWTLDSFEQWLCLSVVFVKVHSLPAFPSFNEFPFDPLLSPSGQNPNPISLVINDASYIAIPMASRLRPMQQR